MAPCAGKCRAAKLDGRAWWGLITNVLFHTQRGVFLESFLLGWLFLSLMFFDPIILQALLATTSSPAPLPSNESLALPPAATTLPTANPLTDLPALTTPGTAASAGEAHGLWYKFALVGILSLSMLVRVTCMELCYFTSVRACNNARSTLVMAIFHSSLTAASSPQDTGRLTNLMATDADKFGKSEWLVWFASTFTFALISLPAVLFQLYTLLGTAAFVGFATLLLTYCSSTLMGTLIRSVVKRLQERRDERGQLVAGLLEGIRLIKLQGSQEIYRRQLSEARELEMRELMWQRYLSAVKHRVPFVCDSGGAVSDMSVSSGKRSPGLAALHLSADLHVQLVYSCARPHSRRGHGLHRPRLDLAVALVDQRAPGHLHRRRNDPAFCRAPRRRPLPG
jgi:ABC-type multidrug transport system fused ATPase/permease subunit